MSTHTCTFCHAEAEYDCLTRGCWAYLCEAHRIEFQPEQTRVLQVVAAEEED